MGAALYVSFAECCQRCRAAKEIPGRRKTTLTIGALDLNLWAVRGGQCMVHSKFDQTGAVDHVRWRS